MITDIFNDLTIGQILSNKHAELDYEGKPIIEGYDYEIINVDKINNTITLKNLTFNNEYTISKDDGWACLNLYVIKK